MKIAISVREQMAVTIEEEESFRIPLFGNIQPASVEDLLIAHDSWALPSDAFIVECSDILEAQGLLQEAVSRASIPNDVERVLDVTLSEEERLQAIDNLSTNLIYAEDGLSFLTDKTTCMSLMRIFLKEEDYEGFRLSFRKWLNVTESIDDSLEFLQPGNPDILRVALKSLWDYLKRSQKDPRKEAGDDLWIRIHDLARKGRDPDWMMFYRASSISLFSLMIFSVVEWDENYLENFLSPFKNFPEPGKREIENEISLAREENLPCLPRLLFLKENLGKDIFPEWDSGLER